MFAMMEKTKRLTGMTEMKTELTKVTEIMTND